MRLPATLIAIPLFVGCAAGIFLHDSTGAGFSLRVAAASALALIAALAYFADGSADSCTAAVVLGCAISGVSLGLSAAYILNWPPLGGTLDGPAFHARVIPGGEHQAVIVTEGLATLTSKTPGS